MRFGSLFAGIGGFDAGLEASGMESIWQVEIDKYASQILEEHWPQVTRYGDVTAIDVGELEGVDLICGGFPCQDLSVAGKRAGLAGKRSGLFWEVVWMAEGLRPQWLLLENVPGLLSSNKGADFATILEALGELGYGLAWRVLDSQYFGLAQRRKRVFIVGYLGGPCPPEILFESESGAGDPQSIREAGEETTPIHGGGSEDSGIARPPRYCIPIAHTLKGSPSTSDPTSDNYVVHATQDPIISKNRTPALGGKSRMAVVDAAWKMRSGKEGGGKGYLGHLDKVFALGISGASQFTGIRRLTPTECERLQGFPDGWTGSLSDTRRYMALGNAVSVPVAAWIGHRILQVHQRLHSE